MISARKFCAATAIALIVAVPSVAGAHGLLRSSSPAADSVVRDPPTELRLTFTEAPERTFTRVRLFGAAGEIALHPFEILAGNVVVARIATRIGPGDYRVEWQTAGDDGHPVSGRFTFVVALAETADSSTIGPAAGPSMPHVRPASGQMPGNAMMGETDPFTSFAAIFRWLTLLGAVAAIGTIAFRYTVLARVTLEIDREIMTEYLPDATRGAAMVGAAASALLLITGVARLLLQSLAVHGSDDMMHGPLLSAIITDTNWGLAWATQLAGALAALVGFLLIRRGRPNAWLLATAGCTAVAVGLALASHAAVVPRLSGLSVAANIVHTGAAAGWLGNLLLVFAVGLPLAWRLDRDDRWTVVRDVVHAFSPAALAFGGLAALTGIFMAWTHVGSFAALTGTDYGNVLLLKLGLLSLTALTGAYNWLRVRPALGEHAAARRLRRTAGAELAIATLVLAVTAVLVALPIPID